MRPRMIRESNHPPWWRSGIFPLVWLMVLSGVGFVVHLPVVVDMHQVAAESGERHQVQDAQHATTVAMALGASAMLVAAMLWDQVRGRAEEPHLSSEAARGRITANPDGHSPQPATPAEPTFRRVTSPPA